MCPIHLKGAPEVEGVGSGGRADLAGSRGRGPVEGLGDEVPQNPPEVDGFVVNKHPNVNHFYVIKRNLNRNI